MRAKTINELPERTFALILDHGDEVVAALQRFAAEHGLAASRITAIGAFARATLGYFDWESRRYLHIAVDEQVEVLSLVGDIALHEGAPRVHAHAVLGRRDGSTCGGHLLSGEVRPTLEALVTDSPNCLARRFDPESGLALIRIDAD